MSNHVDFLRDLGATCNGVTFAAQFPMLHEAWRVCNRADWMLWLLDRLLMDISPAEYRLLACDFAEDVLQFISVEHIETQDVCEGVIEIARRHAFGDADDNELTAARDAAWAAAWAAWAAGAAAGDAANKRQPKCR